jgi:large subunit ribosomal protein L15
MVVRKEKRNRKYLGTRRWGVGNIKNARGAGDRGGVGGAGARKHNFTHMVVYNRHLLHKKGFTKWDQHKLDGITLDQISKISASAKGDTLELENCKVLSNGNLGKPLTIRAAGFSKKAAEKIKAAGGTAVAFNGDAKE